MTKVSVIVAAYNVEEYIEECLHSMINQTLEDVEFIIVDDGSTDKTGEIITKWLDADSRIKLVTHEKNKGLMLARKTGYDIANSEYIMFLDGDDSLNFKACETAYNAIKKSRVDILQFNANVFGDKDVLKENEESIKGVYNYLKPLGMRVYAPGKGGLLSSKHSKDKINFSVWNKIYKKTIVEKVSEFIPDEHVILAEDVLFSYFACFFSKTYNCIDKKLYNYRFGNGISTTKELSDSRMQSVAKSCYVYNYLKEWTEKQGCTEICKSRLDILKAQIYNNVGHTLLRQAPKKKRQSFADNVLKHFTPEQFISALANTAYLNGAAAPDELAEVCSELDIFKTTKKEIKTIATFYHRIYNGGVENVLSQLTDIWVKSGYNVILYTNEKPNENDYYVNSNVTRVVLPEYKQGDLKSYEKRISALRSSLLEHNVDTMVYHAWIDHYFALDALTVKSTGIPFAVHTHGVFCTELCSIDPYAAYKNATLHRSYLLTDMVVGLSKADVAYWSALGKKCIKTINPIPYALDTKTAKLNEKNIVIVCRISREKQIHEAVKIFQKVIKKVPDAKLTIVGGGDEKLYADELKSYITDNKLDGAVEMVGFKKDVLPYYQAADVMLITSKFEGYCLSLVESKICGIPLVTYDLPNLDTVREGKGMFVVPQNDIDEAAERIIEILSDDKLKKEMGAEARKSAEELLSFDIAKHWEYIFEQTLIQKENNSGLQKEPLNAAIDILLDFTAKGILTRGSNGTAGNSLHIAALEATIKEIKNSTSYRLGWFLTTIPRKIKDYIKARKHAEHR